MIRMDRPELAVPRRRRLEAAMDAQGADGWLLTTTLGVRFATGCWSDATDLAGEFARPLVAAGDAVLEAGCAADDPGLVEEVASLLPRRGRLAVDRLGLAQLDRLRELRPGLEVVDAAMLLGAAQNPKDPAEVRALVEGHHRTEAALAEVLPLVEPGITERELNAAFLLAAARHGLEHLHIDTVFTVLPASSADAPWVRGAYAKYPPYRELTGDRVLGLGDHLSFDGGFLHEGYMTDVGWTIVVGREPTLDELALTRRWRELADRLVAALVSGASAASCRQAVLGDWPPGERLPLLQGLYLAHAVGLGGVEPPFVGADFDAPTEAQMLVVPGQVVMVEPYVFAEGAGGFHAEYAVVVGEKGPEVVNRLPVGAWPGERVA
jgi:Xaa-Pro dipeptidase